MQNVYCAVEIAHLFYKLQCSPGSTSKNHFITIFVERTNQSDSLFGRAMTFKNNSNGSHAAHGWTISEHCQIIDYWCNYSFQSDVCSKLLEITLNCAPLFHANTHAVGYANVHWSLKNAQFSSRHEISNLIYFTQTYVGVAFLPHRGSLGTHRRLLAFSHVWSVVCLFKHSLLSPRRQQNNTVDFAVPKNTYSGQDICGITYIIYLYKDEMYQYVYSWLYMQIN